MGVMNLNFKLAFSPDFKPRILLLEREILFLMLDLPFHEFQDFFTMKLRRFIILNQ